MLGIKDGPPVGFDDESPLSFELGINAVSEDGFADGSLLNVKLLGLNKRFVEGFKAFSSCYVELGLD
jgi:hypothetical protein